MLIIITWSSLVLVVVSLGVAGFGIVRMRAEDALVAARGKMLLIVSAVSAVLFLSVFFVGLFQQRRSAVVPVVELPGEDVGTTTPRGLVSRDGDRPRRSPVPTVQGAETERVIAVSPPEGVAGRIVTVLGAGFGVTPGTVQFIDSRGTMTPASTALPSECTSTPWSDRAVFVLVPALPAGTYEVTVERPGGTPMNRVPFRITQIGARTHLCRVQPEHGIPNTTSVTLVGADFGGTPGKVFFGSTPATTITSWSESAVVTRVPVGATTGNIRVVTSAGIRSNEVPFTIGQCTSTSCSPGQTCCSDGLCRPDGTCPEGGGACTYRWFFSTGASLTTPCGPNDTCPTGFTCDVNTKTCKRTANPPCGPGGACAYGRTCDRTTNACVPIACGPGDTCPAGMQCDRSTRTCSGDASTTPCGADGSCPQGLLCNRATNVCTPNGNPPCGQNDACPQGRTCDPATRTCDPIQGRGPCRQDSDCASGQYCSAATNQCTDGTPRLIEEPGCTNTMQSPTPYRGRIDACTNARFGARFSAPLDTTTVNDQTIEVRQCGSGQTYDETQCTVRVAGTIAALPGQDGLIGFVVTPTALLTSDTWYSALVRPSLRSRVGVSIGNEIEWHARTAQGACTIDHIEVMPARAVVSGVGQTQGYDALATAQNCNVMTYTGPYRWRSQDEQRVTLAPLDTEMTIATARAGTPAQGVTIEAESGSLRDTGVLVARLPAPRIVQAWPTCATACRNAELGIRFSIPMRRETLSASTIRLDACGDDACTRPQAAALTGFRGEDDDTIVVFASTRGVLQPATRYRMTLATRDMKSRDGIAVDTADGTAIPNAVVTAGSVAWIFRTADTRAVCTIDRVAVTPAQTTLRAILQRASLAAVARSKPDSCDRDGQRLNGFGLPWAWDASMPTVAALADDGTPGDAFAAVEARSAGTTAVTAETSGVRGAGTVSVVCAAASDRDCDPGYGMGTDHCCYTRPRVTAKSPEGARVCRNGVVIITFDQPMDSGSVAAGIVMEKATDRLSCAPNAAPRAPTDRSPRPFCPVSLQPVESGNGTTFTLIPDGIFPKQTDIRVHVAGMDATAVPVSVKNRTGVALASTVTWSFTTGDTICTIDTVEIVRDPPREVVTSDRFLCSGRDNCPDDRDGTRTGVQHRFSAVAKDRDGHDVQARFTWVSSDPTVLAVVTSTGATIDVTAQRNGNASLTLDATAVDPRGGTGQKTISVTVQACANPWPPFEQRGGQSVWAPFADAASAPLPTGTVPTNFETFYCRDRGGPELADDLPTLSWPPAFERGATKAYFLKGFLFQATGGKPEDAIGLEVFANPSLQLTEWYASHVPRDGSRRSSTLEQLTVNGYPALRDGRTVYVNAANIHNNTISTNVYLLSVGLGASDDTAAIARQLLDNMRLTTTIAEDRDRQALRRDIARLLALRSIRSALEAYKSRAGGRAPTLPAGSFIPHVTFSAWPISWGRLAGLIGAALPVDPVNRMNGCTAPYDTATCWDPKQRKMKCPTDSLVYAYRTNASGSQYTLGARFEYTGPGAYANDAQFFSREGLTKVDDVIRGVCTP